jgi:hypothetical protein
MISRISYHHNLYTVVHDVMFSRRSAVHDRLDRIRQQSSPHVKFIGHFEDNVLDGLAARSYSM